jgi:hypothetical protein
LEARMKVTTDILHMRPLIKFTQDASGALVVMQSNPGAVRKPLREKNEPRMNTNLEKLRQLALLTGTQIEPLTVKWRPIDSRKAQPRPKKESRL